MFSIETQAERSDLLATLRPIVWALQGACLAEPTSGMEVPAVLLGLKALEDDGMRALLQECAAREAEAGVEEGWGPPLTPPPPGLATWEMKEIATTAFALRVALQQVAERHPAVDFLPARLASLDERLEALSPVVEWVGTRNRAYLLFGGDGGPCVQPDPRSWWGGEWQDEEA